MQYQNRMNKQQTYKQISNKNSPPRQATSDPRMGQNEQKKPTISQPKLELLISDKTVEKIMGPEPIPTLDIEMNEIQNELQKKMVEEI